MQENDEWIQQQRDAWFKRREARLQDVNTKLRQLQLVAAKQALETQEILDNLRASFPAPPADSAPPEADSEG